MPTTTPDLSGLTAFLQERGLPLLIILLVTLVAFRLMRPLAHRLITRALQHRAARHAAAVDANPEVAQLMAEESLKRVTTLEDLVATILKVTVLIVAGLVILTVFDLLPVIAGLGLIAVALTLAGQSIVLDYLMGILIVLEGPYYKGDWVQIGGVEGEVEEVGMRRTVIRDGTGYGPQHLERGDSDRIQSHSHLREDARRRDDRLRHRHRPRDRHRQRRRCGDVRRPGMEQPPARGSLPVACRRAGRAGDDPPGGWPGPRLGPVRRAGRAPQAAARSLPGERDRDRRARPDGAVRKAPVWLPRPRPNRTPVRPTPVRDGAGDA